MGGIGYFYGTSKVDVSPGPEYAETDQNLWKKAASARSHAVVEEHGPYQLFSAVPSRPFFPRGFLWDEGFHLQVILDWDVDLALEIVSSWFDLMDENG
jgi:mannosyl-oligosaccharide glucosidase